MCTSMLFVFSSVTYWELFQLVPAPLPYARLGGEPCADMQGSRSGCGCLVIPGVSQVGEGEHRRSYDMYMGVARFTGVVPPVLLLYRCCTARILSKFRRSGLELSLAMSRMVGPHHTPTRTCTEAPFVAVTKTKTFK